MEYMASNSNEQKQLISSKNILLAPREDRDLLGAFSNDVLSDMDNDTIEKIKRMGHYSSDGISTVSYTHLTLPTT